MSQVAGAGRLVLPGHAGGDGEGVGGGEFLQAAAGRVAGAERRGGRAAGGVAGEAELGEEQQIGVAQGGGGRVVGGGGQVVFEGADRGRAGHGGYAQPFRHGWVTSVRGIS